MKVLVSAYACTPWRGSEEGVGWNFVLHLSQHVSLTVLTRKSVQPSVEKAIQILKLENVRFVFVEIPKFLRILFNERMLIQIHYAIWQVCALLKARELMKEEGDFDLLHHITFVNNWVPPLLFFINKPFVWGPTGTNPRIPLSAILDWRLKVRHTIRNIMLALLRTLNPLIYLCISRSKLIMPINEYCRRLFPFSLFPEYKFVIFPAVGIEKDLIKSDLVRKRKTTIDICFVSILDSRSYIKGLELLLHSFAMALKRYPDMKLTIVGDGVRRKYIENLASKLNIMDKIELKGLLDRNKVLDLLESSDIFLYPSFEGGGIVVLEAMAKGLPVICLNFGGPGDVVTPECGMKVEVSNYRKMVKGLADAIVSLALDENTRYKMGLNAIKRVQEDYVWEKKIERMVEIYKELLTR